ncbi:MAG TPA: hypothetical protein DD635_09105 [Flavobacteriales bacterium]|nr:hypothetical protein [Flavobacteriales bacterium]
MTPAELPIVFFDGPCGLCQRSIQWLVRHERVIKGSPKLHFASLQSDLATDLLPSGLRTPPLEGLVFSFDAKNRVGAVAVRALAHHLHWPYRWLLALTPSFGYRWVARKRMDLSMRLGTCDLENTEIRERLLH